MNDAMLSKGWSLAEDAPISDSTSFQPHTGATPAALGAIKQALRAQAQGLGFGLAGFTTAEPLAPVHQTRWARWRVEDKAGAMGYLMREMPRRTHPRDLLPEAQSALVVAAGYYAGDHPAVPKHAGPADCEGEDAEAKTAGKVARYAWGADYHTVLRERLNALAEFATQEAARHGIAEPVLTRPCVDSAPIDERALAVRAGLGFIGKNTLLLNPRHGSWMLLGVLLLSLPLPPDEPGQGGLGHDERHEGPQGGRSASGATFGACGGCTRCIEACPTGAIEAPFRIEPRRCISYLTIESRDPIPTELAPKLEGWAFGCDVCQQVCPLNATPLPALIAQLGQDEGIGPLVSDVTLAATPSGKAFQRRWAHTPLARAGLKGLKRNLKALGLGEK